MEHGYIKAIVYDKGFGFVKSDNRTDYFFHRSVLDPSLEFGPQMLNQRVTFITKTMPDGRTRAVGVRAED